SRSEPLSFPHRREPMITGVGERSLTVVNGSPPSRGRPKLLLGTVQTEVYALAASRFFAISRLRSSASGDNSSSRAFIRDASRPPRWSTNFPALADRRSRTGGLRVSERNVRLHRWGRNRRLVLRFEWLTL